MILNSEVRAEKGLLELAGKFLLQLSYWLHQLPEFYLQKLKREEIRARLIPFFIHFVAIAAGYTMKYPGFQCPDSFNNIFCVEKVIIFESNKDSSYSQRVIIMSTEIMKKIF